MRFLATAFACIALAAWGEGLYKWVDEKGVTHYSESPPPEGTAAKKLDVQAGKGTEPDWRAKELESKQQHILKEQADKAQAAKDQEAQARRKAQCRDAQDALDRLRNSRRVYRLDDKGERVYIEDEQRQREIGEWEERAKKSC